MRNFLFTAMAFVLLAPASMAEAQVKVRFSSVPPWPTNGKPPPELAGKQFVYLDVETGEYVICYPRGLETGEGLSGPLVTLRWAPANLVEPEIAVSVSRNLSAEFVYDYTLRNSPTAKRPIKYLSLIVRPTDRSIRLEHPRWYSRQRIPVDPPPNMPDPRISAPLAGWYDPPELSVRANMGMFLGWTSSDVAPALAPGLTLSGFRIVSAFRPGITTAYARNASALAFPRRSPGGAVDEQLLRLQRAEVNSKWTLTIGPKFDTEGGPEMSDVWVAADFAYGIRRLLNHGRLSADSPFVQEALSLLQSFVDAERAYRVEFEEAPSAGLETELGSAIRLALKLD